MPKVYVEYHDHHNRAILMTFENEEHAMKHIALAEGVHEKEVWEEMFNKESDECFGEFSGMNQWIMISAEDADYRAGYWARVAAAILADQKAPTV